MEGKDTGRQNRPPPVSDASRPPSASTEPKRWASPVLHATTMPADADSNCSGFRANLVAGGVGVQ